VTRATLGKELTRVDGIWPGLLLEPVGLSAG
jgi:hypothetical protein